MTQEEYIQVKEHLKVPKEVMKTFSGRTIDNVVMNLEQRLKEFEKK